MFARKIVLGLLGAVLLSATSATANADFGFSFRYGGGYRPVYYRSYAPVRYYGCYDPVVVYRSPVVVYDSPRVVYRSYPRYYTTRYYGGGGRVRVYYRD